MLWLATGYPCCVFLSLFVTTWYFGCGCITQLQWRHWSLGMMFRCTLATPILQSGPCRPSQIKQSRPDFMLRDVHKDICGSGAHNAAEELVKLSLFKGQGISATVIWSRTLCFGTVYLLRGLFSYSEKLLCTSTHETLRNGVWWCTADLTTYSVSFLASHQA